MKKIIKLTESDLTRIVKRVMNEQGILSDFTKNISKIMNIPADVKKGFETGCYTVKSGDQLLKIALKFGITLDDIMSLNGLKNGDIHPGQKLRVKNTTVFKGC